MNETNTFHTFSEADLTPLAELLDRYRAAYPCRAPLDGHVYLSPLFENGRYVLCAAVEDRRLAAYAAFYPQDAMAWAHILVEPGLAGAGALRAQLFDWLSGQARQAGTGCLAFQYFPAEEDSLAFVQEQGAGYAFSIYAMDRLLDQPTPDRPAPPGFEIRCLRMQSEAEQREYLAAYGECFPEAPLALEAWQYLVYSPWWAEGACVTGYAGGEMAGSVAVYWEPGSRHGFTEYVFTRPAFRGRGLAPALLCEALRYIRERGLEKALLEVKAENENALKVYRELGYRVISESQVWEVRLGDR
jgi:ribosomal protein S18 acetylase RimI-like enzyme